MRHALSGPRGPILLVLALLTALAAAPAAAFTDLGTEALALVNESRAQAGIRPLARDPALDRAAQIHAVDMLNRRYFAHASPEGRRVIHRVSASGGRWAVTAENIAWCAPCRPDGERLRNFFHAGWMRSAGHRRNILDRRLRAFGFAAVSDGRTTFAVQVFGGGDGF